jgi:hypothetical protein
MRFWMRLFWGMARGRRTPRDVPATGRFLSLCALGYLLTSVAQAMLLYGVDTAFQQGIADLLLTALLVVLCLQLGRRTHRITQTLAAVFGVGALLAVPMLVLLGLRPASAGEAFTNVLSLLSLPLVVWQLVVFANILREALDAPRWASIVLSLGYCVISYLVLDQWARFLGA